jgi:hypothetical protein
MFTSLLSRFRSSDSNKADKNFIEPEAFAAAQRFLAHIENTPLSEIRKGVRAARSHHDTESRVHPIDYAYEVVTWGKNIPAIAADADYLSRWMTASIKRYYSLHAIVVFEMRASNSPYLKNIKDRGNIIDVPQMAVAMFLLKGIARG